MPLVLNGATSGSTTIQATDAVTATLTLPSSTGTLISTASSGQVIPSGALPAGSILQVVNGTTTSSANTTSTSYQTSNFSVSITPKFSSSKVLVMMRIPIAIVTATTEAVKMQLWRNGSSISTWLPYGMFIAGSTISQQNAYLCLDYLDSPSSTSSVTYTPYFASANAVGTIYFCGNNNTASITLLEIAA